MKTEIEAMFADIDHDVIRKKLEELGGVCTHPMRDMRRALVETEEMKRDDAFLRVRDEGDKVTLTYKRHDDDGLHGTKEIEVIVSDFEATVELLKASGLEITTYQESRRETWRLGEAEVVLDEWPWIPQYIEIEAESEEVVRDTANKLGLDWAVVMHGGVDKIYEIKFPERTVRGVIDLPEVRFSDPVPAEFQGAQ